MAHRSLLLSVALWPLLACPAAAGEAPCWLDNGVVVVTASVGGVVGDYVLDTGTAHTQMGNTQAQAAGYEGEAFTGEVVLAGQRLEDRPVAVASLDMRTGALPTPVAGVIGADVLQAYVVDLRFAPCRVALHAPGRAPPFKAGAVLPLGWAGGLPVVEARAADGPHVLTGSFSPATGADTAVRLADDDAHVAGAKRPQELYPYGVERPRLRALELAGALFEDLPGGLLKADSTPALGEIGAPLLSRYALRFDFPAGRLLLAPARK